MNIRQQNALITKEKIYNSAIELFEKQGFEPTTISDITKAAGTAKGTFYVHYKSKNDLVSHTVEVYNEISRNAYQVAEEVEGFESRVLKYVEGLYIGVSLRGREIIRALYRNNIVDTENQIVNNYEREIYNVTSKLIQYGLETGALSDERPAAYYLNRFIITYMGIDYYWCCSSEYMNLVDVAQRQFTTLLNGMVSK